MNAYEHLCQYIEGQPEQACRILANRESDTFQTEPNYRSTVMIVQTTDANINASKEEQSDTLAVKGVH